MPAQLVALGDGPAILIDKPILLLGRHPECDIQIESRKISRKHCCIAQVEDYLVVRDLDSTNGIRINGVRVVEGKLRPGDELTIGSHVYQVIWEDGMAPRKADPARKAAPIPAAAVRPKTQHEIPVDDELLESSDEPVALPDPAPRPHPTPRGQAIPRKAPYQQGSARQTSRDDSFVIPDNLELLPNNGSWPGLPGGTAAK